MAPLNIRTWQYEAAFVAVVLAAVAYFTGNDIKEWIGAAAVLFSFMHAQVSDRMAEEQAAMPVPSVECHSKAGRYFLAKEALWFVYFVMSQTWAALVGVGIFLIYPFWRRYYKHLRIRKKN